jgi:hypothetical protein
MPVDNKMDTLGPKLDPISPNSDLIERALTAEGVLSPGRVCH